MVEKSTYKELLVKRTQKICSKCKKPIPVGEPYVEGVLTDEIICSDCDEGLLVKGDLLFSID